MYELAWRVFLVRACRRPALALWRVCVCVYAAHLNINSKCLGCHNNISFQYAAHNAREQPSKAHNERREHVAGYLHEAQSNEGSWAG